MKNGETVSELNIIIENLEKNVLEKHNDLIERLDRIETQTTKTNGRVAEIERWRWMIIGAVSILSAIVLPIAFIIIKNLTIK